MSVQENLRLIRTHYEAVNHNDLNAGAMLVDKNFEWQNVPMNIKRRGQQGYRDYLNIWLTAMPDFQFEVKNMQANNDWVVTEFTGRGTNNGPLNSSEGPIMPTGKKVEVQFCELFQIKNGKIVKGTLYFDYATLIKQLGVVPELKFQE